jgi:hypothetical protein
VTPHYGKYTVCRPLLVNIPERPAGAVLETCPYCGAACWKLAIEPEPLPPDFTAACTHCALKRASLQREMDLARSRREANAAPHWGGGSPPPRKG